MGNRNMRRSVNNFRILHSLIAMQRDDNNKIPTSVEIVDVPPPTYNETEEEVSISAGMTQLSKEELQRLFHDRNLAFVATLSNDGSPHVTPVWTEMVDDLILINTFETSAKNKHITNDKRVALSIVEQNNQLINQVQKIALEPFIVAAFHSPQGNM